MLGFQFPFHQLNSRRIQMAKQKVVIVDTAFHSKGCASVVDSTKSAEAINEAIAKLNLDGFRISHIATINGSDEFLMPDNKPIVHFTSGILLLAEQE